MKKIIMVAWALYLALLLSGCATTPEDTASSLPALDEGQSLQGPESGPVDVSSGQHGDQQQPSAESFGVPGGAIEGEPIASDAVASDASARSEFSDPLQDPESPLAERIIYFDFDRSTISSDYQSLIIAHAEYLVAHPQRRITLRGYTDERGSREYNLALGDQRARSVADLLLMQGVGSEQINMVSYGEEQPAVAGHDESAWQKNRRVVIDY